MPTFDKILDKISKAIDKFDRQIPSIQKKMLQAINEQLQRLDTTDTGNLKQTVKNMQVLASIKNRLNKIVLSKEYLKNVKEFAQAFNELAVVQNEYWSSVESDFKPKPLLREIRIQAIQQTVDGLTKSGIGQNITNKIAQTLQANITTGGSLFKLQRIMSGQVVGNEEYTGYLEGYTKQVTTDAINQYNAQYTQAVAQGLDFDWYEYTGSDITTTREFCFALTDLRFFHVSEIPRLLKATNLFYVNEFTKESGPVRIYKKTGLPYGMIPGTNAANFFVNRGGYNCGHQILPASVDRVPKARQEEVYATAAYQQWKKVH